MSKYFILSTSLIIILLILFTLLYYNKYSNIEHFIVTTWTPYVMDCDNQPCYSNYFYMNGYMYPIY